MKPGKAAYNLVVLTAMSHFQLQTWDLLSGVKLGLVTPGGNNVPQPSWEPQDLPISGFPSSEPHLLPSNFDSFLAHFHRTQRADEKT